jgi:hypothetical protein
MACSKFVGLNTGLDPLTRSPVRKKSKIQISRKKRKKKSQSKPQNTGTPVYKAKIVSLNNLARLGLIEDDKVGYIYTFRFQKGQSLHVGLVVEYNKNPKDTESALRFRRWIER